MPGGVKLSEVEQYVLLALLRLGDDAYGMTVRQQIEERSGRPASIAAVYAALDRLEQSGLVSSWRSEPTARRGGRAKKHFKILPEGALALRAAREAMNRMWEGVDALAETGVDR